MLPPHQSIALALASQALNLTSPNPRVGCVIVGTDGRVLGQGHTQRAGGPHAEIMALRDAAERGHSVEGATVYVTLEPCAMCAGAIMHARIRRVVFGASDPKTGVCGSVLNLFAETRLNHHAIAEGGLMAEESVRLLQEFFAGRRQKS